MLYPAQHSSRCMYDEGNWSTASCFYFVINDVNVLRHDATTFYLNQYREQIVIFIKLLFSSIRYKKKWWQLPCEIWISGQSVPSTGNWAQQASCGFVLSRFHSLGEFDEGKRSCRKRLADHNRRRRKPQPNASTCGVTSAESIGMTGGGDDGDHSPNNRGATG